MTNSTHQCPSGLRQRTDGSIRSCAINSNTASCSQIFLPGNGLNYSRVCGRIRGYQVGSPDTFHLSTQQPNLGINDDYVDGVSLTHGNPRRHIWTFAAGLDEVASVPQLNCLCTNSNSRDRATPSPTFVGNDYFCDTGSSGAFVNGFFYSSNPLWDGAGCGHLNTCCTFNTPPWFYKELPQPTTDNIEMRVCRDQAVNDEGVAIDMIEIYVQ